jgi:hypothetical protein
MTQKVKTLLKNPRFIAIVGMLGSDGHGEAANAAAKASKMLKEAGTTWGELVAALEDGKGRGRGQSDPDTTYALQAALRHANAARQRWEEVARTAEKQLKEVSKEKNRLAELLHVTRTELEAVKGSIERLKAARNKGWTPFEEAAPEWVKPGPTAHLSWLTEVMSRHQKSLSSWEENFLLSFEGKPVVSEKQYEILKRIAEKTKVPLDF